MIIETSSGIGTIRFEDGEEFAGKEAYFEGERVTGGFQFSKQSLRWLVFDEEKSVKRTVTMDEVAIKRLIPYILSEGIKQGYKFELWD